MARLGAYIYSLLLSVDDSLLSIRCHSGTALDLCTGYWKYPQLSNPDGHNDLIKRTHKLFVF